MLNVFMLPVANFEIIDDVLVHRDEDCKLCPEQLLGELPKILNEVPSISIVIDPEVGT